jgi:kumamolisin
MPSAVEVLALATRLRPRPDRPEEGGFDDGKFFSAANSGGFNDIILGDNKCSYEAFNDVGYAAGPGWDACSGLGSPNGLALSKLLKAVPTSGSAVAAARKAPKAGLKRRTPSVAANRRRA